MKTNLKRKSPKAAKPVEPIPVQLVERRHGDRRHGLRRLKLVPALTPETRKLLLAAIAGETAAAPAPPLPPVPPAPVQTVLAPDLERFPIVAVPRTMTAPADLPAPRAKAVQVVKWGLILGAGWLLFADGPAEFQGRGRRRVQEPSRSRRRG